MQKLAINGCEIPVLGFGTYKLTGRECYEMIMNALEIGYRHIDTAQVYDNEVHIGEALHKAKIARNQLFVTTKVWPDNYPADRFAESVERSLNHLRMDYVDLLLVHWPHKEIPMSEYLPRLAEAKKNGKAKNIGVSNFTVSHLKEARRICEEPLITNQVEYHILLDQSTLLKEVRSSNMFLTAYSPLAQGNLTEHPALSEAAEKHNKTRAQIALRWLIQQPGVVAIPKTSSPDRAKQNLAIFDFELDASEMQQLAELGSPEGRVVNPDIAPEWDR